MMAIGAKEIRLEDILALKISVLAWCVLKPSNCGPIHSHSYNW